MATLTFSFDTGTVTLASIVDDIATLKGYQAILPNGQANPQTKAQFSRDIVKNFIIDMIRTQRKIEAAQVAETTGAIILT